MTPSDPVESLARAVAVEAHAGQVDKAGEPYIGHCERVVARLTDPLDRAVAWLHDVVEDTEWSVAQLRSQGAELPSRLRTEWSNVCHDVGVLTHRSQQPRADYYLDVCASERAVRVKLADIADNLDETRLAKLPEKKQDDLRKKYRKAIAALTGQVEP